MARRVYWILFYLSLIVGVLLFKAKQTIGSEMLLLLVFAVATILITSIHGIIVLRLNPDIKKGVITYPVLMGLLFAAILAIIVFIVLPFFCPLLLDSIP